MHATNKPIVKIRICTGAENAILSAIAQVITPRLRKSAQPNIPRRYQRGLSKQIMKLSKYTDSGATHRNGITATSWQILLVTASNSSDAQAGKRNQYALSDQVVF